MDRFIEVISFIFDYQADRFLTVVLSILAVIVLFSYSHCIVSKRGRTLFWIGCVVLGIGIGLTVRVYWGRLPHGLSGNYYANPLWSDDGTELERYFEPGGHGRRVDRFIDFAPNDFNYRYPFSGKPFSVQWQGYVYIPGENYQLGVRSNFGAWLYVDDMLVEGPHKIDFGTSGARKYLREGWFADELWGVDSSTNFVWNSGDGSEFYLGVDELTDYQLVFRCMPFEYEGSPRQEVSVYIEGSPLETVTLEEGWNTYNVKIPRSSIRQVAPGFFRVRFSASHAARPVDVLQSSQDARQLAVAFDFAAMQKSIARHGDVQEIFQPQLFPKGMHRITLKAQSNGSDPFIRLVWKPETKNTGWVIPEDYLFPERMSPDTIHQILPGERIILAVSLCCKFLVSVFLGILILIYLILPYYKKRQTLNFWFLPGLGILALIPLIFFLLETTKIDPHFYNLPPGTDQLNYVFFARGFFRGYWPWYTYDTLRFNPLVPIFLIITHILFGESLLVSRLIVAVFSAISLVLLYSITRKQFNKPVAILAFLLCALNGVYIFYGTSLLVAPQVTFLNIAMLWYAQRLPKNFSIKSAIFFGILFGLLALGRATFLLFIPFLFLWILLIKDQSYFRKFLYCSIVCVTLFLVILPITTLNYYSDHHHGIVLITDAGGWNFWMGNNSSAHLVYGYGFDRDLAQKTKAHMKATGSSYFDEVFIFLKEQPLDYLKLQWRKLKMFWRGHEIGNLKPYYLFRVNSSLLRLPLVNFVLLGPLSIVGLLLTCKDWKKYYLLHVFVLIQVILNVLFLTLARYRIPAVPILSIFAAYTLFFIYQAFRRRKFLWAISAIVACITLYIAMNYPKAAELHQSRYGKPLSVTRMLRYWDVFDYY